MTTSKAIWFPVLFAVSLCLLVLPSALLVVIIQDSTGHIPRDSCDMGTKFSMLFMENNISSLTHILDIYPIPRRPGGIIKVSVNWSTALEPLNSSYVDLELAPHEHRVIEIPKSLQLNGTEQSMKGVTIGDKQNQVAFVGAEDNTTVVLSLRSQTRPGVAVHWRGVQYRGGQNVTFTLDRGEAVQVKADSDLTGSGVQSDKPVAVFAGNDLTRVARELDASIDPDYTWALNHLVEQVPEVGLWGRSFYLAPFPFASPGYLVKFVCSEASSEVLILRNSSAGPDERFRCSDPGDFNKTFVDSGGVRIEATAPVLVAQMFASSVDLSPSMLLVTPAERFDSRYVFPAPRGGSFSSFVQISVAANETDGLLLDDLELSSSSSPSSSFSSSSSSSSASSSVRWIPFGGDADVVWTSVEIQDGVHELRHSRDVRFGASVVGHSKRPRHCSYAYPAGLCS